MTARVAVVNLKALALLVTDRASAKLALQRSVVVLEGDAVQLAEIYCQFAANFSGSAARRSARRFL
jgi:hypothetical protein